MSGGEDGSGEGLTCGSFEFAGPAVVAYEHEAFSEAASPFGGGTSVRAVIAVGGR